MFAVDQLDQADADVGDGLAAWWVDLPELSYRGRAVVPVDWHAGVVHEALEEAGRRLTYNVCARLYYCARLDELARPR